MRSRVGFLVLVGAAAISCGSASPRLVDFSARQQLLEEEFARDERRAAALRGDSLKLKHRLRLQRECIAHTQCIALASAIHANVMAGLASCNREAANWAACDAQRWKQTGTGAGIGCLAGWALAATTGGAAAPAVVIGCGGGAVAGNATATGDCTKVQRPADCGLRHDEFVRAALAGRHLSELPDCGQEPPGCAQLDIR
jgi:hypothetical protein